MIRSSSKFYRNLSAILSLCLLLLIIPGGVLAVMDPALPNFAGSGTEADPYQISDVEDFAMLSSAMNFEEYRTSYYVLTQDIDLNDALSIDADINRNYRTINMFSGVLDGQGFAIQNMRFADSAIKSTNDVDIMGSAGTSLIDYLQEGSLIKNLKIENVDISAPDYNASVLVNSIGTGASVHNVTISGNVIGDYASGVAFSNDGLISNSVMIGSVSADNAAGIVYRNFGSIKDCTNLSNVDGLRAGGISADNRGQISGCTNEGNVTAYEAGGITAGSLSSISYRSISPSDDDTAERSTIVNCGNSGVVQGNIAGGIAAMMYYSEIHNSYNTGEIIYDDIDITSLSDVSLSGASYGAIGGLVAETGSYLKFSVEDTGILLTNSYNAGVLTGMRTKSWT